MFRYILIATKKGNTKKESKCIKEAIHNCVCSDLVHQRSYLIYKMESFYNLHIRGLWHHSMCIWFSKLINIMSQKAHVWCWKEAQGASPFVFGHLPASLAPADHFYEIISNAQERFLISMSEVTISSFVLPHRISQNL